MGGHCVGIKTRPWDWRSLGRSGKSNLLERLSLKTEGKQDGNKASGEVGRKQNKKKQKAR